MYIIIYELYVKLLAYEFYKNYYKLVPNEVKIDLKVNHIKSNTHKVITV